MNRFSLRGVSAVSLVVLATACTGNDAAPSSAPGPTGGGSSSVGSGGKDAGSSSSSGGRAGGANGSTGGTSGNATGGASNNTGGGTTTSDASPPDGAPGGGGGGSCRHLTFRDDAYAFELRIVNTADFYKVDFPPELMMHCVDQRGPNGVTDPAALDTKCEASYLFKRAAGTAPASSTTETFDIVIPFIPASGFDLKIAKGGKGTTTYEIGGFDGSTWATFDSSMNGLHIARDVLRPGQLAARQPATPPVGPMRGAYLFPWYGTPTGPAGRWVHWDPNNPTLYEPTKGFYDSADPAAIAQQMAEAHSAGLDLFVVSYWDTENPPLAAYLDAAGGVGIRISAMLETATRSGGSPRESVRDQLATIVDSFGAHPGRLNAGGKPIVFVYDRVTSDIDSAPVGATGWDDWEWIATDLGSKMPVLMFPLLSQWASEGAARFGGAFAFAANSGGGSYYTGSHGDDWAWAWTARQAGALLAIPILPSIGRLREAADAPNYRNQWHAARSVMPDMIIVNSWNEYHESTIIEPTTAFGTEYLDITNEEATRFCSGDVGNLIQ